MWNLKTLGPAMAVLAGLLMVWGGCAIMPEEEPVPAEVAILFTASTAAEFEPCG